MSLLNSALLGTALALAPLTTAALAQTPKAELTDGVAVVILADGQTPYLGGVNQDSMFVNPDGHAMLLKHGTLLAPGTIIYRSGNNIYLLENKMIEGQTVRDRMQYWVGGILAPREKVLN
jgi:hypothetical protein